MQARAFAIGMLVAACGDAPGRAGVEDSSSGEASGSAVASSDGEVSSTQDTSGESTSSSSDGDSGSSGGSGESSSTGSPSEPAVILELVTANNRAYPEMHGGWGPHLRAPMQAADGTLWFAFDGGPDVLTNSTINYARRGDDGWELAASQTHAAGVQQNSAHVLRGDFVMTYSVDVDTAVLEECYFDTTDYSYAACNTVLIGGPYSTPPSSNYVGAALGPGGVTIVWFTVVGDGGSTGQFVYTHDSGGGWNGPFATALPGYNDLGYVRASFRAANTIDLIGQAYVGDYPDGAYATGVDELVLGQATTFETLGPAARPELVRTGADVWVDPDRGDTHGLARVGNDLAYYFVPAGESWAAHLEPVGWIEDATQARWLYEDGGPLVVVIATAGGVQARWAELDEPVDWASATSFDIAFPVAGLDQPTAIYAAGPQYQSQAVAGLHFAVCGAYGVADEQIWYGALTL